MTVRPLPFELMSSSNTRVGFLNMTAVLALPMEMLAPAENVPSSRSSAIRLPPSSTTAITPPGACSFLASFLAAAMTCSAPCRVSVSLFGGLRVREARKAQNRRCESPAR